MSPCYYYFSSDNQHNAPFNTPNPLSHTVDSKGAVITTRILGFLDRRPQETALYLTLRTAAGHNLTLSPNHVLFRGSPASASPATRNASQPASSAVSSVFGGEVNLGDVIFSASSNQTGLEPTEVVGFDYELMQGKDGLSGWVYSLPHVMYGKGGKGAMGVKGVGAGLSG